MPLRTMAWSSAIKTRIGVGHPGTSTRTRVPPPGSTDRWPAARRAAPLAPPSRATPTRRRSGRAGSKPTPSSTISRRQSPSSGEATSIRPRWACLRALLSASWVMRSSSFSPPEGASSPSTASEVALRPASRPLAIAPAASRPAPPPQHWGSQLEYQEPHLLQGLLGRLLLIDPAGTTAAFASAAASCRPPLRSRASAVERLGHRIVEVASQPVALLHPLPWRRLLPPT